MTVRFPIHHINRQELTAGFRECSNDSDDDDRSSRSTSLLCTATASSEQGFGNIVLA